jgi:hypothetical protein
LTADSALLEFNPHTVSLRDTVGYSTISDQVVIAPQTILATADVEANQTVFGSGVFVLEGTMTNAKSPIWFGSTGTFNPLNTISTTIQSNIKGGIPT